MKKLLVAALITFTLGGVNSAYGRCYECPPPHEANHKELDENKKLPVTDPDGGPGATCAVAANRLQPTTSAPLYVIVGVSLTLLYRRRRATTENGRYRS